MPIVYTLSIGASLAQDEDAGEYYSPIWQIIEFQDLSEKNTELNRIEVF